MNSFQTEWKLVPEQMDDKSGNILYAKNTDIYKCGSKGIGKFDGTQFVDLPFFSKRKHEGVDSPATNLYIDSKDRFWIFTKKNLYIFDSNYTILQKIEFESDPYSNQLISEDGAGSIWLFGQKIYQFYNL